MKKQIQKLAAWVSAAAMLCTMAVTVSAAYEGPAPAFKLDIEGFDPAAEDPAKGLSDGSGSEGAVIETNTSLGGEFTLENGNTTKYLEFEQANPAAKNVVIDAPAIPQNPKEFSVEMWANVNFEGSSKYAKLMQTASKDTETVYTFVQRFSHEQNVNFKTSLSMAANTPNQAGYGSVAGYMDKWTHFVFVWRWNEAETEVTIEIYADGKLLKTETKTGQTRVMAEDKIITLGSISKADENPANMKVGSFNLYNQALTLEDAQALYADTVDQYVYIDEAAPKFEMDLTGYDPEGVTSAKGIRDISGNGAAITANTALGGGFKAANGNDTKYVSLREGDASNIKIDTAAMGPNPQQMSFEMWANVDDPNKQYGKLFALATSNGTTSANTNLQFMENAAGNRLYVNAADGGSVYETGTPYFNKWTHYAVTYDWTADNTSVTVRLYADGKEIKSNTFTGRNRITDNNKYVYYIGAWDSENTATMDVGTFKMYNRLLTPEEIQAAYTEEAGNYVPAETAPEFSPITFDVTSVREGTMTASTAARNYTGSPLPVTVAAALYKDGRLIKTAAQAYTVPNGTDSMALSAGITLALEEGEAAEDYTLKAYVWDSLASLRPYLPGKTLSGEKPVYTVAFLGGSITEGAGAESPELCYVSQLGQYLTEKYSDDYTVQIINAGKGGTPSSLGSYRLGLEVIPYEPDVVFVEFAQNDAYGGMYAYREAERNMESIVRQLLQLDKQPQIVFLYTTNTALSKGAAQFHTNIADYYGIPYVDLQQALSDEITKTGSAAADYFAPNDSVHPNGKGHGVYAATIQNAIETQGILSAEHTWKEAAYTDFYVDAPTLVSYVDCATTGSWTEVESDNKWIQKAIYSETAGDTISYTFDGACVGVYAFKTKDSGKADYTVTDQYGNIVEQGTLDLYGGGNTYCDMYVSNLASGKHTITLTVTGERNAESTGGKVQIGYFMVDPGSRYVPGDDTVKDAFSEIEAIRLFDGKIGSGDIQLFPDAAPTYINTLINDRWARWNKIDFGAGGAVGMTANLSSGSAETEYMVMDIYLDSLSAAPVGTLTVYGTGGWGNYVSCGKSDFTMDISGVTGIHDVYLVPRQGDAPRLAHNLHSIQFIK